MIRLLEPAFADVTPLDGTLLESHLTYIDKKLDYDIKRLKNAAHWYAGDPDREQEYQDQLAALKEQRKKVALFRKNGQCLTYSGLAYWLAEQFQTNVQVCYPLPEAETLPYANKPKHNARPYQNTAHDKLLDSAHKGPRRVEIGTGLGKSTIIRMVVKSLGLKTVIMAPSTNIANQLYNDLVYHFGKRYVGFFGSGKKQSDKLIVVGIDDSLTKVEPGSDHWDNLSSAKIFIADESHLCPAETLAKVCLGLCRYAPYRFFFSATQVRQDGLELVLDGITGETVFEMTVKEGVDQGYLARPYFKMVEVQSYSAVYSKDPNKMTRHHLYYNNKVVSHAASLANMYVEKLDRPTVILVEELEQFRFLLPYFKHQVKFAHGPLNKDTRKLVPTAYQDDDPNELVAAFNEGKFPILVGTSCIATGTDIQAVGAMIYLMGKSSEVKTKQAVGRSTRGGVNSFVFYPNGNQKLDCIYVDYDVTNIESVHRHALIRKSFYDEIYGPVEILK